MAIHGLHPSVSFEAFVVRTETDSFVGSRSRTRLNQRAPRRAGAPRSTRFVSAVRGEEALKSRRERPGALLRIARKRPGEPGTGSSAFTCDEALPAKVSESRFAMS